MGMLEWAKREVEIACKKECGCKEEGEFDYGCECYKSALKAFESLCIDEHSGCSIVFTKNILNRLIDGKPLTPIYDTDDVWRHSFDRKDTKAKVYRCKRMSSLFKEVYPDETVKYNDVNRVVGINIDSPDVHWHMGLADKIVDDMYPISMPYIPENELYKVYVEEFLTDRRNGDFDTVGVFHFIKPDGEKVEVNRFFKEGERSFVEISKEEYEERRKMKLR